MPQDGDDSAALGRRFHFQCLASRAMFPRASDLTESGGQSHAPRSLFPTCHCRDFQGLIERIAPQVLGVGLGTPARPACPAYTPGARTTRARLNGLVAGIPPDQRPRRCQTKRTRHPLRSSVATTKAPARPDREIMPAPPSQTRCACAQCAPR